MYHMCDEVVGIEPIQLNRVESSQVSDKVTRLHELQPYSVLTRCLMS